MRLTSFIATALALTASAAAAENHYSAMLADTGLGATAATLAALPNPTPSDQFALGGVQFLSVVEGALQTRYTYGMSGELTDILELPLLRLPIFDNPTPAPFSPAVVNTIFADALVDLDAALTPLDTITNDDDVAVTINVDDIWFDINMNELSDQYTWVDDGTNSQRVMHRGRIFDLHRLGRVIPFDPLFSKACRCHGRRCSCLTEFGTIIERSQGLMGRI